MTIYQDQSDQISFEFPGLKSKKVEAKFSAAEVSSDGGILLLRQADRRLKLLSDVAKRIEDVRRKESCEHTVLSMLRQRVYGLCLGYEDLNDHQTLRKDSAFQTAVEEAKDLSSSPTLCRLENRADRKLAWDIHQVLFQKFVASYSEAPKELILDFDATDDIVHGKQEGRFFHGYYDHYCFLPLYVFCKDQLLVSYLRPSNIDGAKHAWAILSLLVKGLRERWPGVKIIFRGDSGFCRDGMLSWCERKGVDYVVGMAQNFRLNAQALPWLQKAEDDFLKSQEKQKQFYEMRYAAQSWKSERRIIVKAEHTEKGSNPRYIISTLDHDPKTLYEKDYCARGEMENRIKEQQGQMFADRTSCHKWWANQFRLLLSSLAYTLMETIRRFALQGTELAEAQVHTIRLKLLKIGAVILKTARHIRFLLSSHFPYQKLFRLVAERLSTA